MPDKIFVAMKVPQEADNGQRQLATIITQSILGAGHEPFIAYQEIQRLGDLSPQEFMPFVRQAIHACQLALILYNPSLRGGLIEAGLAYAERIPIWVMHSASEKVSSSLLGCAERVLVYRRPADLQEQLTCALESLSQPEKPLLNQKDQP